MPSLLLVLKRSLKIREHGSKPVRMRRTSRESGWKDDLLPIPPVLPLPPFLSLNHAIDSRRHFSRRGPLCATLQRDDKIGLFEFCTDVLRDLGNHNVFKNSINARLSVSDKSVPK